MGAVAALVPIAVFSAAVPAVAGVVLAVGMGLLVWFLAQGLRGLGPEDVTIDRTLPRRLFVGQDARVEFRLRNRTDRSLVVRIADGCPSALVPDTEVVEAELAPFEERFVGYAVKPARRGSFTFGDTTVRLRHPAGLAEAEVSVALSATANVHPDLAEIRDRALGSRRDLLTATGTRRARLVGRDGDFERLREFVSGDDIRRVDWKATARAGRPIVRVHQTERAQNLILLVDGTRLMAARAANGTKMDFAVRAALLVAWVALSRGDRVGVAVFDAGVRAWLPPGSGPGQFRRILDLLFDQQPVQRFPRYREAARRVASAVRRRSLLVWLTDLLDAEQGRELLSALRAVRARHLSLVVAIDDPDVRDLATAAPVTPAALYTSVAAGEILDERETLIRRLRVEGARVVDKRPEEISASLVDRYLQIKQRGDL